MNVTINSVSYLLERKRSRLQEVLQAVGGPCCTRRGGENVLLLHDVSMQLKPGTVTALMGLGYGHKCLLECIALRQKEGLLGGTIEYDGAVRQNGIFKDIVLINDIGITHFECLSVFDYLYYGARLRVSHGIIECRERARLACRAAGLDGTAEIGRLNPTEVRLLSVAAELVANPTLICMVDPTDGLDASGCLEVLKMFWSVSKRTTMPTTVVYNMPSINHDMLPLLDRFHIFVGNTVECSKSVRDFPTSDLLQQASRLVKEASLIVLDSLKYESEDIFAYQDQQATYLYSMAMMKVLDDLKQLTANIVTDTDDVPGSANGQGTNSSSGGSGKGLARSRTDVLFPASRRLGEKGLPYRYSKTLRKEFSILFKRSILYHWKNQMYHRMGLLRYVASALLLGFLVFNNGDQLDAHNLVKDKDGIVNSNAYNLSSALFAMVAWLGLGNGFIIPFLYANVQLLKFEVASGLQNTVTSWMSLVLLDLPASLLASALIGTIMFLMLNIQGSAIQFFITVFLVSLSGYSSAALFAIWMPSKQLATFSFAAFSALCLLFCGYLQFVSDMGGVWKAFSHVLFTRWAFESLSVTAFEEARDGDDYLGLYSFDDHPAGFGNTWLLVWFISLQALILLGLSPPMYNMQFASEKDIEEKHAVASEAIEEINFNVNLEAGPAGASVAGGGGGGVVSGYSAKHNAVVPTRISSTGWYEFPGGEDSAGKGSASLGAGVGMGVAVMPGLATTTNPMLRESLAGAAHVPSSSGSGSDNVGDGGTTTTTFLGAGEDVTTVHLGPTQAPTGPFGHPIHSGAGGAYLDPVDELIAKFAAQQINPKIVEVPKPMMTKLAFSRLKFVQDRFGTTSTDVRISGVSGSIDPGSFCCILDGMGDGTSEVLLRVLAGKTRTIGKTTGVITANAQRLGSNMSYANAAYVQRGDVPNVASLTVREVLRYAALLRRTDQASCLTLRGLFFRMNGGASGGAAFDGYYRDGVTERLGKTGDVEDRVQEVLMMTGLESIADCVVGVDVSQRQLQSKGLGPAGHKRVSVQRGVMAQQTISTTTQYISNLITAFMEATGLTRTSKASSVNSAAGSVRAPINAAQLRCLTIGTELVNRPGLVFLEDPFAELQWHEAEQVARMLQSLARGGRTVICNISRPWQQLVMHTSDMLVLGSGLLVYSGPTDTAAEYFQNIGFEREEGQNDLDYVMEIASDRGKMTLVGGKRGNTLSPEDLSDLNRSLANIKAGRDAEDGSLPGADDGFNEPDDGEVMLGGGGRSGGGGGGHARTVTYDVDRVEPILGGNGIFGGLGSMFGSSNPKPDGATSSFHSGDSGGNSAGEGSPTGGLGGIMVGAAWEPSFGSASAFGRKTSHSGAAYAPGSGSSRGGEVSDGYMSLDSTGKGSASVRTPQQRPGQAQGSRGVFPYGQVDGSNSIDFSSPDPLLAEAPLGSTNPNSSGSIISNSVNTSRAHTRSSGGRAMFLSSTDTLGGGVGGSTIGQSGRQKRPTFLTQHNRPITLPAVVSRPRIISATGPTARVLAEREFRTLLADKKLILAHFLECLIGGVLLGSVWWRLDDGDYQSRMGLFAAAYICINLFIVDSMTGIFTRKDSFLRDNAAGATGYIAYYVADAGPSYIMHIIGSFLFALPLYSMAGLKPDAGAFVYFTVCIFVSVYTNFNVAYLLSIHTRSVLVSRIVFTGVVLPLQLLFSGYLVLLRTVPWWISWAAYMCPMSFYMSAVFRNEFDGNDAALGHGDLNFNDLADFYNYHYRMDICLFSMLTFGMFYKMSWLFSLRMYSLFQRRAVLHKVYSARRKARRLIKAGLRWRDNYASTTTSAALDLDRAFTIDGGEDEGAFPHSDFGPQF